MNTSNAWPTVKNKLQLNQVLLEFQSKINRVHIRYYSGFYKELVDKQLYSNKIMNWRIYIEQMPN